VDRLLNTLSENKIEAAVVGDIVPESEGIVLEEAGRRRPLEHPRVDPFWSAFGSAMEKYAG
jgi:hydrogenase maturation factor